MKKIFRTLFSVLFLTLFLATAFLPFSSFAQVADSDVSVDLAPQSPGAFADVTITLQSFSLSLDSSSITWKEGGKFVASSTGMKSYSTKTGAIGTSVTITAEIRTVGGDMVTKTIVLRPASVDMLWEAYTYVPPFYKGKALPSEESKIHVVAIPQMKSVSGGMIKPTDVVYSWKRNDDAVQGSSGFAKQEYIFDGSYLDQSQKISVVAQSTKESTSAAGETSIIPGRQKILFYPSSPLYGLDLSKTINKGFSLRSGEVTIFAAPYNFSIQNDIDKDVTYKWKINSRAINTPDKKNILTIKPISGQAGIAQIELGLESITKLYELATAQMQVTLGQ